MEITTLPKPSALSGLELQLGEEVGEGPADLEPGDEVTLIGHRIISEFRGRVALVISVAENHCTTIVMDETWHGIGECWPNLCDVTARSSRWRIGERVTVSGLKSAQRKGLNGALGEIIRHPRQGHPCFVSRPGIESPLLTFCICLDVPWNGKRFLLLEPQYLVLQERALRKATDDLSDALLFLSGSKPQPEAEPQPENETHQPEAEMSPGRLKCTPKFMVEVDCIGADATSQRCRNDIDQLLATEYEPSSPGTSPAGTASHSPRRMDANERTRPLLRQMPRIEQVVFGQVRSGGLLSRLRTLEQAVIGSVAPCNRGILPRLALLEHMLNANNNKNDEVVPPAAVRP